MKPILPCWTMAVESRSKSPRLNQFSLAVGPSEFHDSSVPPDVDNNGSLLSPDEMTGSDESHLHSLALKMALPPLESHSARFPDPIITLSPPSTAHASRTIINPELQIFTTLILPTYF
jgi:hypothetical protein